ncbi:MAG: hypothetical protein HDS66_00195 [Bacteroidales bacterium]|nr:hypothetical protein [Bacteroidales bacterium]
METNQTPVILQFKLIPVICVVLVSGLLGWSVTSLIDAENMQILIGICTGVMAAVMFGVAVCCTGDRQATMLKVSCISFGIIGLLLNALLALLCETVKPYVITSAIYLLIWLLITYRLYKARTV